MNEGDFDQSVALRDVSATVKWFNPIKGFGFVQPNDGSPDAFLHISVVERFGHQSLPQGATIVCDIAHGQKGPQVAAINRLDAVPAAPDQPSHDGEESVIEGKVKFFNAEKGFGFVIPDDGGKDIFVSARMLERLGLGDLESNQRVRMTTRMGQKGPMAESLEII